MDTMSKKYIAYYRVSTTRQGESGLGLSAQKEAVRRYLGKGKILLNQYQEVESGRKSERPQLKKAIAESKETGATLIIAKLDRLSRNVGFIFTLKESGVDFVCADMPDANTLTIGLMSVLAQEEAQRTSDRTIAALSEIKRKVSRGEVHISKSGNRVTRLGNPDNLKQEHRQKGANAMRKKANSNPESRKAGAYICSLREQGYSFSQITKSLNEMGFTTPTGKTFTQTQTKRLFDRFRLEPKETSRVSTVGAY